ncbi:MAG TPA: ImmA/IrrE family metallo-endopeptidase [Candidatus Saccharimonadales bacterium]|nr:ImmA/IrrE family metallo-endopeptidase [Candidatus Saccharimonadales bacterium]
MDILCLYKSQWQNGEACRRKVMLYNYSPSRDKLIDGCIGMPANYIARTRQFEINNLIDEILLNTDLSYPESSVIDIIKAYIPDVSIVEDNFDGDSNIRGAIFKKSKEFTKPLIVIQKKLTKVGKTFTLAHEFGHYCLGHTGSANFMIDKLHYDGSEEMQKEGEAQYFAGALLMPVDKFMKLDNVVGDVELARRFGVSESAVRVRKAWLHGKDLSQ